MPLLTDMVKYSIILCYFFKISPVFINFNLIQHNANKNLCRFLYIFLSDFVKNNLNIGN